MNGRNLENVTFVKRLVKEYYRLLAFCITKADKYEIKTYRNIFGSKSQFTFILVVLMFSMFCKFFHNRNALILTFKYNVSAPHKMDTYISELICTLIRR